MGFEYAHLIEGGLDGNGKLHLLSLVGLAGREQNHEESKQQGNEGRVGNQPTLVAHIAALLLSGHCVPSAASTRLPSNRKVRNLISSMRGFIPSWMEITPSSIISLTICSSCWRILSLPAAGRKTRLASPTP